MKVTLTVYDETRRETWRWPELCQNAAGGDEIPNEGIDAKVRRERMMPKLWRGSKEDETTGEK